MKRILCCCGSAPCVQGHYLCIECALLLWQSAEAFAQNFRALHDVDKGLGVDVVELATQLNHVGAVKAHIEHLALIALVEATAGDARATALEVVDDIVANGLGIVGDDEHCAVALHAVNHEVDNLALNEDDEHRVDGKANVAKCNQCAQGYNAVNNHH